MPTPGKPAPTQKPPVDSLVRHRPGVWGRPAMPFRQIPAPSPPAPATPARAARPEPIPQDHPQRYRRHQQRRNPRGNDLLRPVYRAIAAQKQQDARNNRGAPLSQCRLFSAHTPEYGVKHQTHRKMPQCSKYEGREALNPYPNGKERGAPQDIDRSE